MIGSKVFSCAIVAAVTICFIHQFIPTSGQSFTTDPSIDYYPLRWAQIDSRPIIDNERLFKKYKECIIADKPKGCPRDISEMKRKFDIIFYHLSGNF